MDKSRVLIVDDEPMQRRLISEILKHAPEHYEINEASNGAEAVDLITSSDFDVILMDKSMPGMSGDEVCQKIRNELNRPLLPVIMVTGKAASNDLAASLEAGANEFVSKPFNPAELVARIRRAVRDKRNTDELDNAENLLFALARMVEAKDETTGDHCTRLSHMATVFGKVLGLTERELTALRRGGILHDIGKLGIPDSILLKNGPLNNEEWQIMRQHTVIGGHLCSGLKSMRDVTQIIECHHERLDGSGYPYGLKGDEIPLLAKVFQIVDIYDALSSVRPYKVAFSQEKIISIFEEETSQGWRDPELVSKFIKIVVTEPLSLKCTENLAPSEDEIIYNNIVTTGLLDWINKEKMGNTG